MAEDEKTLCTSCKKRPARSKGGLCQPCNMKERRAKESPRERANRKRKDKERQDIAAQYQAAIGEVPAGSGPPPADWEAPTNLAPLTGEQRDTILVRASTRGPAPADLNADPKKMTLGHFQLWKHVKAHDAVFRRDIIRRLQSLGMDNLSIIATFIAEPALRERWVDPLRNPKEVFRKDFKTLSGTSGKTGRTAAVSLRDYIERLGLTMRMAFEVASNQDAPATVRKDMLILSGKLARDIALLEHAIKPIPGAGDVPSQQSFKSGVPAEEPDAEDEGAEEEEEGPGGYSLPEIKTGGE